MRQILMSLYEVSLLQQLICVRHWLHAVKVDAAKWCCLCGSRELVSFVCYVYLTLCFHLDQNTLSNHISYMLRSKYSYTGISFSPSENNRALKWTNLVQKILALDIVYF